MSTSQKRPSPSRKPQDKRKRDQPPFLPGHRKPGRPGLLTPVIEQEFIGWLRSGVSRARAARTVGLSPYTVEKWMRRGRGTDPGRPVTFEHKRFLELVLQAEAQAEAMVEANVVKLSAKNFEAGRGYLQRIDPTWHPDYSPPGAPLLGTGAAPQQLPAGSTVIEHQNVIILAPDQVPDYVASAIRARRLAEPAEEARTPMIPERVDGPSSLRDDGLRTD